MIMEINLDISTIMEIYDTMQFGKGGGVSLELQRGYCRNSRKDTKRTHPQADIQIRAVSLHP